MMVRDNVRNAGRSPSHRLEAQDEERRMDRGPGEADLWLVRRGTTFDDQNPALEKTEVVI